jgi:hypothetical protein
MVHIGARGSTDELLRAAGRLSQPELEQLTFQIITLRAQRQAPSVPQAEAKLLLEINRGLPSGVQKRSDELIAKRQAESLTSAEYDELLRVTDQVEGLEARRVKFLIELACLRKTSLTRLMKNLKIRPPAYV